MLSSLFGFGRCGMLAHNAQVQVARNYASSFRDEEVGHYQALFKKFDHNRDAHLDRWEFNNLVRFLVGRPYPTTDLDKVFKTMDASQDRLVNLDEYMTHIKNVFAKDKEVPLDKTFNQSDTNNDNRLEWTESRRAIEKITGKKTARLEHHLFKKNDVNNDNHLSFGEFTRFVEDVKRNKK